MNPADPAPIPTVAMLATVMEDLSPEERDRRIRLAGDKVIDLREAFTREQEQRIA